MIIIDTSIWIEFLKAHEPYFSKMKELLEQRKVLGVGCWIKAGTYSQENNHFSKGVGLIDSFIIIIGKLTESKIWTIDKKIISILEKKYIYT